MAVAEKGEVAAVKIRWNRVAQSHLNICMNGEALPATLPSG